MPLSEKQLAANRANAATSRGPVTALDTLNQPQKEQNKLYEPGNPMKTNNNRNKKHSKTTPKQSPNHPKTAPECPQKTPD